MKKILPILLLIVPMWCMSIQATGSAVDIVVMNDIHVMHPDLLKQDGAAFENVMKSDRKLLRQSQEIFLALIDSILLHQPDVVLIPGDLTKDGELIGHQLVSSELKRLQEAGIQTYVIPGNHDIRNAGARYFDGDSTWQAEITLKEDFEIIYQDFGYGEASVRDTASLSYITDIAEGVSLLAIDAVQWYNNTVKSLGDAHDNCISQGKLRPETLQWLLDRADEAKAQGKQVVAMMHQELLQQLSMQSQVFPTASIEGGDSIAQLFIEHGIHVIFTGHMHITNNSTYYNADRTDSIVEISTGSPVSYPCPYRWVTVDASTRELSVATHTMQALESVADFPAFAKESLGNSAENLVRSQVGNYWPIYEILRTTGKIEYGGQTIDVSFYKKLFNFFPSTQEECIAIADYHFNDVARALLYTTSEGNEPERDSVNTYIRTTLEEKIQYLLDSIVDNNMCPNPDSFLGCGDAGFSNLEATILKSGGLMDYIKSFYEAPLNSILEDKTYMDTEMESVTDDLNLLISLPYRETIPSAIESVNTPKGEGIWYDVLGRPIHNPTERGIYIRQGEKILIP